MKTKIFITIFILFFMTPACLTFAENHEIDGDIWLEPNDRIHHPYHKRLTPEMVDRILDRMAVKEPEQAERLRTLKQEDPASFRKEFREIVKQYRQKHTERPEGRISDFDRGDYQSNKKGQRQRGNFRKKMQEGKEQFEQWLQENYPQRAVELSELEDENPRLYRQELMETIRQYGQLYRAEKDNPELADVLKQDMVLKKEVDEIVDQINQTDDKNQKQKLKEKLNRIISERFDLIIKRKELQIAEMKERLQQLQKKVYEKETDIQQLKIRKEAEVNSRIQQLLSETDQLNWN